MQVVALGRVLRLLGLVLRPSWLSWCLVLHCDRYGMKVSLESKQRYAAKQNKQSEAKTILEPRVGETSRLRVRGAAGQVGCLVK